jgi:hypothetical protein
MATRCLGVVPQLISAWDANAAQSRTVISSWMPKAAGPRYTIRNEIDDRDDLTLW